MGAVQNDIYCLLQVADLEPTGRGPEPAREQEPLLAWPCPGLPDPQCSLPLGRPCSAV